MLTSKTCTHLADLSICQISLDHIMCLRLFRCVGRSEPSEVLAYGPAPDSSSSDSLLTPGPLSHNALYISQGAFSLVCVQPTSHEPSPLPNKTSNLGGEIKEPCNYVKCLNTLRSMAALLPRGTNPGLYAAKPLIKHLLSTRQYLPQHLCLSTAC